MCGTTYQVPLNKTPKAWLIQALMGEFKVSLMSKLKQNIAKTVAVQIELAIKDAGYRSQEEFANVIGMPKATLNRVLSGSFDTRISTLEKIAQGLGLPMGQLLDVDPSAKSVAKTNLHSKGPKQKSGILVKILVPKDEEPPKWLVDACREGAGQIEKVAAKRKPKTTDTGKRRQVGLDEILDRK